MIRKIILLAALLLPGVAHAQARPNHDLPQFKKPAQPVVRMRALAPVGTTTTGTSGAYDPFSPQGGINHATTVPGVYSDGTDGTLSQIGQMADSSVQQADIGTTVAGLDPYGNVTAPVRGDVSTASAAAQNGLISATLATRFSRALDVILDGGAQCNGSNDDGPAITALLARAAGNASVRVPTGLTCRATSIVLPSYSHLTVDGILQQTDAADQQFITINTKDHIVIDGSGIIDGNRSSYPSSDSGVYACINANGTQYFTLTGVTVQNCKNYPVNIWNGAAHAYINHVRLLNSGNSPECAQNVDDCWVDHAYISGISDVGWSFYKGVSNSGITNSRATGNSGAGITSYLDNASTETGNRNIVIAGNIVDHNGGPGIMDQGAGSALTNANSNVLIAGNIVSYNNQDGQAGYGCIFLANDYYANVSNNSCSNDGNSASAVYGIWLQTQNYYVTVRDNKIWNEGVGGSLGVGILVSNLSYYTQIVGNEIFADQGATSLAFGISGSIPAVGWAIIQDNVIHGLVGGAYTNLTVSSSTTFNDQSLIQRVTATGSAITVSNYMGWLHLYQDATVSSQTITLPARAGNGQTLVISTVGAITALSVTVPSGLNVVGAPTTLAAGSSVSFRYDGPSATWVRVQ